MNRNGVWVRLVKCVQLSNNNHISLLFITCFIFIGYYGIIVILFLNKLLLEIIST